MTDQKLVLLEVEDGVATITLNRPQSRNVFDREQAQQLGSTVEKAVADAGIRVVVLRGAGAAFCAGADLPTFVRNIDNPSPMVRDILGNINQASHALRESGKLIVAGVHGVAAGVGLSLAIQSDFCIAADTTTLIPGYALIGLSPDGGATKAAVERLGVKRAIQLYLGEETLDARRGAELGLIDRIVPEAELDRTTRDLAQRLARNSADAILHTKSLLRRADCTPHPVQLQAELEAIIDCMGTEFYRVALHKRIEATLRPRSNQ